MTEYVLSIDPGVSTGISLVRYPEGAAPELVGAWQFSGGAKALSDWLKWEWLINSNIPPHARIAEKFTARNTRGFSYTTPALEPLRCEGVLIAYGLMPDYSPGIKEWRDPGLQYLVGGKDLADKKRRQHAFLKGIGFYRTNKDFPDSPAKDGADDFRSSAAHNLNYGARVLKHKPTFDLMTEWSSR